jgi:hypothetical protein
MNKNLRSTLLGVGLAAAFFISCGKANAVSITVDKGSFNVTPGGVIGPEMQTVTGKASGMWHITMNWNPTDPLGDYQVGTTGTLTHHLLTDLKSNDLIFQKGRKGSYFETKDVSEDYERTGDFHKGEYVTAFMLKASIKILPEGAKNTTPNDGMASFNLESKWVVTPVPVPWETDAIPLIVTTGLFLGGIAIKGKLANKNLDSISEKLGV